METAGPQPTVSWRDCISVPPEYALNDVALAPSGDIYATHMFARPESATDAQQLRTKFLAAAATGFALHWSVQRGWRRMPGTELSFANGIAVSGDGHWLAVAGTFDQAVLVVDLRRGDIRRVRVALQPDNITPFGRSSFIVVGHTGVPVTGIDPCRNPQARPCGFPFSAARISAPGGAVTPIYTDDGKATPGASVAVLDGRMLYLGSAFGDRVSVRVLGSASWRSGRVRR